MRLSDQVQETRQFYIKCGFCPVGDQVYDCYTRTQAARVFKAEDWIIHDGKAVCPRCHEKRRYLL